MNVDKLINVQLYQIINDMRNCFAAALCIGRGVSDACDTWTWRGRVVQCRVVQVSA